ncbi:hypothetical protein F4778DRAFT_110555 [Xylariomycetidae sp. FL2044]|nr:hypothetical protein F4778DRAFT_110555 [Xylariomycetidae sp. FL2044]
MTKLHNTSIPNIPHHTREPPPERNYTKMMNDNLIGKPISAAEFNALPHVQKMKEKTVELQSQREQLLRLIAENGVSDIFTVHLIHKHYDVEKGQVIVHVPHKGQGCPDFTIGRAHPASTEGARGLFFIASPEEPGKMYAYEYTTAPADDLSRHGDFVAKFAIETLRLGVREVFALAVNAPDKNIVEVEIPRYKATVSFDGNAFPEFAQLKSWAVTWGPQKLRPSTPLTVPGVQTLSDGKEHYIDSRTGNHGTHKGPGLPKPGVLAAAAGQKQAIEQKSLAGVICKPNTVKERFWDQIEQAARVGAVAVAA